MDKARKKTDKELVKMERQIKKIYREARDDIGRKWIAYMEEMKPILEIYEKTYQNAKKFGDKEAIEKAGRELAAVKREYTLQNKYYKDMVRETSAHLTHANETALAYINKKMPKIYAINYNQMAEDTRLIEGYTFNMVNERAVRGITKTLNEAKDMAWNTRQINSQVLQGIIQGESIDKIAGRLEHIIGTNTAASIRTARTMTTGAENRGRQDSYEQATEDGIILKRVWVATNDNRTREWHADLDGVETDVDEPWENEIGEIMFPGDPSADGANIYNCRCAMRVEVKGFDWRK